MKKAFVICLISLLTYQTVYAQSATSKQFNELKRSQKYFYSEATLPSRDDAKIVALANLVKQINDSLKAITNDSDLESSDLEGHVLYMEMNREGGIRVLAYVDKSNYLNDTTKKENSGSEVASIPVVEALDEKVIEDKGGNDNSSNNTSAVVKPSTEASLPDKVENLAIQQRQYDAVEANNDWISNSINALIKQQALTDFCDELEVMSGQHKIKRYSSLQQCRNVQDSYIAVFDKDDCLIALLGPLTGSRYNFQTKAEDTLEKYKDQNDISIICFQFSK